MPINFNDTKISFEYKTNKELKKAFWLFKMVENQALTRIGSKLVLALMKIKMPLKFLLKPTLFEHFCGGENIYEAITKSKKFEQYNVGMVLDYGVEGKQNETDFDQTVKGFIEAITQAAKSPGIPFIAIKITGFARFTLLEKIHNKESLTIEETNEWKRVVNRAQTVIQCAHDHQIKVSIDAEESWIQRPIDELTYSLMEKYNQNEAIVFYTYQMYKHDMLDQLKEAIQHSKSKNYFLGAKLVRGAYMEKERERAKKLGYLSPIQPDKQSTDRDYNEGLVQIAKNHEHICVFVGTHNEYSCEKMTQLMEAFNIPLKHVYFSQLFGMSDNITFNLSNGGYQSTKYMPYGPVNDVLPYLMRRAMENSSVNGQMGRELSLINKEISRRKKIKE